MAEAKGYRCVNCGEPTAALYRTYGPSVVKLNKCERCKRVVDKYIEYDPVIVLIDLVLVSQEAQRHVLYNTHFKLCWKLAVLCALLHTYCSWSGAGLLPLALHALCHTHTRGDPDGVCAAWAPLPHAQGGFIWEKHFYVHFTATALGMAVLTAAVHWSMALLSSQSHKHRVGWRLCARALTLGGMFVLGRVPALVWSCTRAPLPHALVLLYTLLAHTATLNAKDLHKLPPVSFDYIDVTKLLKDIAVLKQELFLAHTKYSEVTVTNQIQLEVQKIKDDISQLRQEKKSESVTKSGYNEKVTAGSSGTQPLRGNNQAGGGGSTGTGVNSKPKAQPQRQQLPKGSGLCPPGFQVKAPTALDSLTDEEGFTTVVRRKKKTPRMSENKRGSAPTSEKIKAAPQVVEVFVSQLDPSVTEENLKEYIVDQGEQAINVFRLGGDDKRKFASFKVVILKDKAAIFLSDKFWPENILFRQFERRSSWKPQYRGKIVSSTPKK